jgi:outer membrane protein TolC
LNRDYYRAGTSKMSDLLEAQLLYQQSLDHRTDAYADYQNKLLEYRQATGMPSSILDSDKRDVHRHWQGR